MANEANCLRILDYSTVSNAQTLSCLKSAASYSINYVLEGEGKMHTQNSTYKLCPGDVFFCLPAVPYAIESVKSFKYSYISFLGSRADAIIKMLRINENRCVFTGLDDVGKVWINLDRDNKCVTALRSESVLLYTFSCIQTIVHNDEHTQIRNDIPNSIKEFIDDNITNFDLTLEKISHEVSYDKRYISMIFKNTYQINITEYITSARIQIACNLINKGFKCVSQISSLCGYKDPLYFSRVFKLRLGVSPRTYIAHRNSDLRKTR